MKILIVTGGRMFGRRAGTVSPRLALQQVLYASEAISTAWRASSATHLYVGDALGADRNLARSVGVGASASQ